MWFIPALLSLLVAAHSATSKAVYSRQLLPGAYDGDGKTAPSGSLTSRQLLPGAYDGDGKTAPAESSTISHRDSSCINIMYGAQNPSEMCGSSTFESLTDVHCRLGDASLVDDCKLLIADLEALNGGGFWGYMDQGILTIASHGTCSFHIEKKKAGEYDIDIGTRDIIDIVQSAMGNQGFSEECNGKQVMAGTGVMSCKHGRAAVDTTWWIEGPYSQCD